MKKNTLIRSDKPHAVKMAEGENVAQRKSAPKSSPQEHNTDTPDNLQKLPPVKTARSKRVQTPAAEPTPAARPKAKLGRSPEPSAKPVKKRSSSPKPRAPTSVTPLAPAQPLWESDNPIKSRIEQLKTRNAQLAEQLQRLTSARPARGQ